MRKFQDQKYPMGTHSTRRHFLRGVGAAIALPCLPSLMGKAAAQLEAVGGLAPIRSAFVYAPNGVNVDTWKPTGVGTGYELSPTLQPLAELKEHFQVFSGFKHDNAEAGPDGGGDHARANATFLTGLRAKKTGGADIRIGVSVDQVIANQVGPETLLPSLELSCDDGRKSGSCDSGYACAYQFNLSWKDERTPMSPISVPRRAFERMFGSVDKDGKATMARRAEHRSILDFVSEDAKQLGRQMGLNDRHKVAEYLDGIRSIEKRIERIEKLGASQLPNIEIPKGKPKEYGDHIRLMYDMMVLAFQTDLTRVSTFLLAHDGSNRSFREIGVSEGHHTLSHHRRDKDKLAKIAKIDRFYCEQFSYFLRRLAETKDVDGNSLLHNSMIVYGGGISDADRHDHDKLPILLAGHAGGSLQPGRHVDLGDDIPLSNLYVELINRAGGSAQSFGDSNGVWADV